ncbi:hypothetical protein PG984_011193 [Apiospora sp. TS-2023a]
MWLDYCRAVSRHEHVTSFTSTSSSSSSSTATTGTIQNPEPAKAQLQEHGFASKAKDSTHYYHPDAPLETHKNVTHQPQQVEGERCPVALRWESPKSTIQLEDLLFGIGSQFDDMPFSPRQLSYIHAAYEHKPDDKLLTPDPSLPPSMAAAAGARVADASTTQSKDTALVEYHDADDSDSDTYADENTILLVDKGEEGSSRLPLQYEDLPVATSAPRSSAGSSYLRRLSGTLASTMRRLCVVLWKLVRWRVCNGIHGSGRRRQQPGGHEKHGGARGGVIYLA